MSMAATEIERGEVDKLPHVPGVDAAKLSLTAPKCMETQEKGEISAVVEGAPYQTIPATPMAAATVTGTREAALVWGVDAPLPRSDDRAYCCLPCATD